MQMTGYNQRIMALLVKLEQIAPDSIQARNARQWFDKGGFCRYSNEDFDILQSVTGALAEAEREAHHRQMMGLLMDEPPASE